MNWFKFLIAGIIYFVAYPAYADFSSDFSQVERFTANRNIEAAMNVLQGLHLPSDETLKYLNQGMLLRLQGKYKESNENFEQGKNLMQRYQAISVIEQAASVAINDTYKAYEGLPSEQLAVYALEALNFLESGNIEDAAVEARQFNVKQGLLAQQNNNAEYLSGAFVRYLNGLIFEANRENDDARIEFQKAIEGYRALGMNVPQSLQDSLSRVTKGSGKQSEIILVLQNGLGPALKENKTRIPNPSPTPNTPAWFTIALPEFVERPAPVARIELSYGSLKAGSELVEDINLISRKSFDDKLPSIKGRAVARMAVKSVGSSLIKQSGVTDKLADQFGLGSFKSLIKSGVDVAVDLTESADTRTWALLPSNILMARLPVSPSKEAMQVTATYYDAYGNNIGEKKFDIAAINQGQKIFLSDYNIKPETIISPSRTNYASNSASSSSSQEVDSLMFFGLGVGIDSGYTDFENQVYSMSNTTGSPTPNLNYSLYLGGYSGLLGFELGYKIIGGFTDRIDNYSSCYFSCKSDTITLNGDATYYALLLRSSKSKNYVYLKAGLADTNITIQTAGGIYQSGHLLTSGTGSVLGIGWDMFPFRMELENMTISLPTPYSNGFNTSKLTNSTLTTFNFGLVF